MAFHKGDAIESLSFIHCYAADLLFVDAATIGTAAKILVIIVYRKICWSTLYVSLAFLLTALYVAFGVAMEGLAEITTGDVFATLDVCFPRVWRINLKPT